MAKTLDELRAEYPDLTAQLEREARASAVAGAGNPAPAAPAQTAAPAAPADLAPAEEDPVAAERARIQAIDEIAPSILDPKLVEDAKYGHPCTAEQLAFRAMKAQAAQGKTHLEAAAADYADSGMAKVKPVAAPAAETAPESPEAVVAQAKADMEAWKKIQKEGK